MNYAKLKEYPGYEIYEDGTIFSVERKSKNGKTLVKKKLYPSRAKNGYSTVRLYAKDGHYKQFYLHRLVYMAFYGDITGLEVEHIDCDRSNSALSNLRLCNHATNCRNPRSLERYKKANALSAGKFNRDKMQAAKSQENKERLKHEYMFMMKETGSVGVYAFMKKAHCNYYTALKVIAEMQDKSDINQ